MYDIREIAKEVIMTIENAGHKVKEIEDQSISVFLKKQGYDQRVAFEIVKEIHKIDLEKSKQKTKTKTEVEKFTTPNKTQTKEGKPPRKSVFGKVEKLTY